MKAIKGPLEELIIQPSGYIKAGAGKALQTALANLFTRAGAKLTAAEVGEILKAAELALIVDRLVAFYGKVTIRAHAADDEEVHKPLDRQNLPSTKPERFYAVAGVAEED